MIHCDDETYSEENLLQVGAFKYAEHQTTELLIKCFAFDDGLVKAWVPGWHPPPLELFERVGDGEEFAAHNAEFEWNIWNGPLKRFMRRKYPSIKFPRLKIGQLNCTAGRCAMAGMPRSLEKAGEVLKLDIQKDKIGKSLINFFCKPQKPTKKNPNLRNLPRQFPDQFKQFINYCRRDVLTERELDKVIPEWTDYDRMMYRMLFRVNVRGIPLDINTVKKTIPAVRQLEQEAQKIVTDLTGGIKTTQVAKMRAWLKTKDVDLPNMQSKTIINFINDPAEFALLDNAVKRALLLRIETGKVSTKKLNSMLRVASAQHRAHGTLLYYGAHTGRASGKYVQPHNFIRGLPDKKAQIALMDEIFPWLDSCEVELIQAFHENPITAIAMCMRGFIAAKPGSLFRIADYAQIEARVLVWLARQDDVIEQFKAGVDVYKELASFLWKISVSEVNAEQRQIAKSLVLGCGFGLGDERFIEYAASNGVHVEPELSKRAVKAFREKNYKVVEYWGDVGRCAIAAVKNKGKEIFLRNISFVCDKSRKWLRIVLPSGRSLYYPNPKVVSVNKWDRYNAKVLAHNKKITYIPFNGDFEQYNETAKTWCKLTGGKLKKMRKPEMVDRLTYMTMIKNMWLRISTWGGKLVENIVQAIAADIMFYGGRNAERAGYPLVLTVHDEWLAECKKKFGNLKELIALITDLAEWAIGCPITAEGFETIRFRKG